MAIPQWGLLKDIQVMRTGSAIAKIRVPQKVVGKKTAITFLILGHVLVTFSDVSVRAKREVQTVN